MRGNSKFHVGAWAEVEAGCDIHCVAGTRNTAVLVFGHAPEVFETVFDHEALRLLVQVSAVALAELDARAMASST